MDIRKANRQLFFFGLLKIPMIGYCRPKITKLNADEIELRIGLKRKTRNHVKSMYFGALNVGADLASGFLAYALFDENKVKASLVFAHAKSEFLKRAEADVYFQCKQGAKIQEMIVLSSKNKTRITDTVDVYCMCQGELVATFTMGLSLKVKA